MAKCHENRKARKKRRKVEEQRMRDEWVRDSIRECAGVLPTDNEAMARARIVMAFGGKP